MDFRLVLALWAAAVAPLVILLMTGRGLDRSLLWSARFGIALLYFTPFVITTDTVFPFIVGKALFTRGVIEIVFGMWVVLAIRRPEFRPAKSWLTLLFAMFLLANLVAAFAGVSFTRSFWSNYERMQGVVDLVHWFALFVVMLSVIRGRRQWLMVFNVVVGVGLVAALVGVAQRFDIRVFAILSRESRLTGTLGNATYVGAHMIIVALLSLALLADSLHRGRGPGKKGTAQPAAQPAAARRPVQKVRPSQAIYSDWPQWVRRVVEEPERRIIWPVVYCTIWALVLPSIAIGSNPATVFLAALGATALVTLLLVIGRERLLWGATAVLATWIFVESSSRGAAAALGAGLVGGGLIYALWGDSRRLRYLAGGTAIALVAAAILFALARETAPVQRLAERNQLLARVVHGGFTENARVVSVRAAFQAFAEDPITGWGPENFFVAFRKFQRPEDFDTPPENQDQTHNRPLEVLSGTGLIGFLPYAAMWVLILTLAIRRVRHEPESRLFAAVIAAAAIAYLVHLLFLFETSNAMLLFVTLAAWAGGAEKAVAALPERVDLPRPVPLIAKRTVTRRERRAGSRPNGRSDWPTRREVYAYALPLAVAAAVLIALIGMNARIHRAAHFVIRPAPLDEIAPRLATFPGLGTLGRTQFAEGAAGRLPTVDPAARDELIAIVIAELDRAIEAEPENILVRLAAAKFFGTASQWQPGLLARARTETDKALRLGPHTHEAHAQAVEQALREKDLPSARAAVQIWKSEHPNQGAETVNRYDFRVEALAAELAGKGSGTGG
jgi:hypothetical protein